MLGYLVIYGYIFFSILVLGKLLLKIVPVEFSRKFIHISLFMVWIFIDIFFKNTIHQVIIPFTFIIINYLSYKFKLFKSIEREEDNHLGTVYFSIAIFVILLIAYIFPETYIYTGISTFCLTFGDGFASFFGSMFKSKKIKESKSILGFICCFIFSLISLIVFKYCYLPEMTISDILIISSLSAIFELVGKGLDNFSIVFGIFGISYLLITLPFGMFDIGLIISIIVFLIVFLSKSISYYGSILAMAIITIFTYFGDLYSISFLLICYFISFFISLFRKLYLKEESKHKDGRGFIQILANGFTGTLCLVLFKVTSLDVFYLASYICIGGCLIDSVSSDIGTLSNKTPFDVCKWKYVDKKASGGITLLGSLSSLIVSLLLSLITTIFLKLNIIMFIIITLLIYSDTIIDTILGSLIQNKNKCTVCDKITEKEVHCEKNTVHYSGISFFNNNINNLVSSILVFVITLIVLW